MPDTIEGVFSKYYGRPFVWGESDCCQFVGECLGFLTGTNPARHFRYASEEAANKLFDQYGGLEGLIRMMLGEPTTKPPENGYVALLANPEMVGVVWKDRIVIRTSNDLNDFPLDRAKRYWTPCQR